MNMLAPPVRRTFGRALRVSLQVEATPAIRSDINRFFTAFAGGFVFFSVLFF